MTEFFLFSCQWETLSRLHQGWIHREKSDKSDLKVQQFLTPSKGTESCVQSSASSFVQCATLSISLAFKTSSSLYISSIKLWMCRRIVSRRVTRFWSSTPEMRWDTNQVLPSNISLKCCPLWSQISNQMLMYYPFPAKRGQISPAKVRPGGQRAQLSRLLFEALCLWNENISSWGGWCSTQYSFKDLFSLLWLVRHLCDAARFKLLSTFWARIGARNSKIAPSALFELFDWLFSILVPEPKYLDSCAGAVPSRARHLKVQSVCENLWWRQKL